MKSQKGITLISTIITVIILAIVAGLAVTNGMDTYENSKVIKFQTYMKMIQKKVDIIVEEEIDYTTLGSELTAEQKTTLSTIMTGYDTSNEKLRYFSSSDIEEDFDIKDVKDDIVINFATRDVISLNGVEKDGVMHYIEDTTY